MVSPRLRESLQLHGFVVPHVGPKPNTLEYRFRSRTRAAWSAPHTGHSSGRVQDESEVVLKDRLTSTGFEWQRCDGEVPSKYAKAAPNDSNSSKVPSSPVPGLRKEDFLGYHPSGDIIVCSYAIGMSVAGARRARDGWSKRHRGICLVTAVMTVASKSHHAFVTGGYSVKPLHYSDAVSRSTQRRRRMGRARRLDHDLGFCWHASAASPFVNHEAHRELRCRDHRGVRCFSCS